MRLGVGDRVQPDKTLGTIEKIRTSKEGYLVAEILWDTGASARSLDWLDPDYEIPQSGRPLISTVETMAPALYGCPVSTFEDCLLS